MTKDKNWQNTEVSVDSSTAIVGERVDSGAEGFIHKIKNNEDSVLKIFRKDKRSGKDEKVKTMIANDPSNKSIIWPGQMIKNPSTDEFIGYKMPYKDLDSSKDIFEYTLTELNWSSSNKEDRYTVAHNLAVMVAAIHNAGHAIGDFNHDNILIDDDGRVTLIDCDGFHITDESDRYPDDTYYPRYAPPEGRGGDSLSDVKEADQFCLGVHIFQVLMEGFHPYHAQGPKAVDGSMEDKLHGNKFPYVYSGYRPIDRAPSIEEYENRIPEPFRELFNRCFTESGKNKPNNSSDARQETNRPEPDEWKETIGSEIGDRSSTDNNGLTAVTPDSNKSPTDDNGLNAVTPDAGETGDKSVIKESDGITPVSPENTEQS